MDQQEYLRAWKGGSLCLHPTDTLPGLSFNPFLPEGRKALTEFKGRDESKPFIGLTSGLRQALPYWQALPPRCLAFLEKVWPGPVSVVWRACATAPAAMVSESGELALRCPIWPESSRWMQAVLADCGSIFPTTSVNLSGEAPAASWGEATAALAKTGILIPKFHSPVFGLLPQTKSPSTVIRLPDAGNEPLILREGAVKAGVLLSIWHNLSVRQEIH